jgi:DNA-binding GntR family transcriptional regulator
MPLAVPQGARHRTKQEFVYRTLRDAIMTCELQPDERLVIDDLARRLEVSSIPVREALQILQSEGLVVTIPHVGTSVAPVSRESILDVFTVLEGLESAAIRLVAERADPESLDSLEQLVTSMDEAVRSEHYERWAEQNRRFHLAISAIPGLAMLHEMTERTFVRWDRVRRYYFKGVLVHRVEQAQREHRALLAAIRRRDLSGLSELVRQHNQGALASYLSYLNELED